jgi:two-component system nitrogen regulation sensor histidine kinase NtrY
MDNLQIVYQSTRSSRLLINADRDQLLRCFNNLLKNAIEATPPDRQGVIDINYLITSKNILLTLKITVTASPKTCAKKYLNPTSPPKARAQVWGWHLLKTR